MLNLDFRVDQARVGRLDALWPPDARSKSWTYPECLHLGMVSNRWRLLLPRRPVIPLYFPSVRKSVLLVVGLHVPRLSPGRVLFSLNSKHLETPERSCSRRL
jgi:hypothetical protein